MTETEMRIRTGELIDALNSNVSHSVGKFSIVYTHGNSYVDLQIDGITYIAWPNNSETVPMIMNYVHGAAFIAGMIRAAR